MALSNEHCTAGEDGEQDNCNWLLPAFVAASVRGITVDLPTESVADVDPKELLKSQTFSVTCVERVIAPEAALIVNV